MKLVAPTANTEAAFVKNNDEAEMVLSPVIVCVPVEITPLAVAEASGKLKVTVLAD